jgi:uncharacterized membrane protein YeaQ/YmgE (transglycosylase-associated protein family)
MHGIGLLGVVLVSLLAGWIAARVMRRRLGLFDSLPIGLLGALLGGLIAQALDIRFVGLLGALAIATVGATLLLGVLVLVRRR